MSIKNSSDTFGNRARDLPAFSKVPQPTEPSGSHKLRRSTRSKTGAGNLKLPSTVWVAEPRTIDYGEER